MIVCEYARKVVSLQKSGCACKGMAQSRGAMKLMVERFPEAFTKNGYYSARSVVQNRSILTMVESAAQLSKLFGPQTVGTRVPCRLEAPFPAEFSTA